MGDQMTHSRMNAMSDDACNGSAGGLLGDDIHSQYLGNDMMPQDTAEAYIRLSQIPDRVIVDTIAFPTIEIIDMQTIRFRPYKFEAVGGSAWKLTPVESPFSTTTALNDLFRTLDFIPVFSLMASGGSEYLKAFCLENN